MIREREIFKKPIKARKVQEANEITNPVLKDRFLNETFNAHMINKKKGVSEEGDDLTSLLSKKIDTVKT